MSIKNRENTPKKERVNRDFQRKNVFSYFLPYGMLGRSALICTMPHSDCFNVVYKPNTTLDTLASQCHKKRANNLVKLNVMEYGCYVEEKAFALNQSGKNKLQCFCLSRPSVNLLAGISDWNTEALRKEQSENKLLTGNKAMTTVDYSPSAATARILAKLDCLRGARTDGPEQEEQYERLLCDAICCWDVTMLGIAPELASDVNLTGYYNAEQRYRLYKLANISMMFRQNLYLTCLDRRPLDDCEDAASFRTTSELCTNTNDGKVDMATYTAHCLNAWYAKYPESYLFDDPGRMLSEDYEQWLATPTFYALSEIPGYFKNNEKEKDNPNILAQNKNTVRSTALGIGIGAYVNYLIYHGPKNNFRWHTGIEKTATKYISEIMIGANKQKAIPGFDRFTEHAIMFFETARQFEYFFADLLYPNTQHKPGNIPMPFMGMYLIPINASGVQQLRMLMEFTPYEFMQTTVREICEIEKEYAIDHGLPIRIFQTNDPIFPLSYNNEPVLFAYDMEVRKLRQAIIRYQLGKRFYVACYPEQVRFIQRIMPEVKFI